MSQCSSLLRAACWPSLVYHAVGPQSRQHVSLQIIRDDSHSPIQPQYILEAPRGAAPTSDDPPTIISNQKQSNDRSWSCPGAAPSPNKLPPVLRAGAVACSATQDFPGSIRTFFFSLWLRGSRCSCVQMGSGPPHPVWERLLSRSCLDFQMMIIHWKSQLKWRC